MIADLPIYISIVFGLTALLTLVLFYYSMIGSELENSNGNAKIILSALGFWLVIQAILGLNDFYSSETTSFPPRFALAVIPPFITIIIVFLTKRGRHYIDCLPLENITYLNMVRIPVEITLYWLFLHKAVPKLMTFEGKNFDIISGISAPFVAYYGFTVRKLKHKLILYWNILSLVLLLNVVAIGILSAPFSFQTFSYMQPNIAVLYFPFIWLPSFIVPLIFFGHIVSIRQLLISIKQVG